MKVELRDVKELIRIVSKSGIKKFDIKFNDVRLTIENQSSDTVVSSSVGLTGIPPLNAISPNSHPLPASVPPPSVVQQSEEQKPVDESEKYKVIKAPLIGTFYRSPSPDKPVFIKEGDVISQGDKVCIIEAMKIFNEIEADFSGKVVKILVEDSTPVEYGQPLLWIEP